MKKIILCFALLVGLSLPVHADGPDIDPGTPPLIHRIADGLHVLDNGTVATFFDALHGVPLAGSITTPYKKYYCTLDLGMAYPLTVKGQNESTTLAEFIGGIRLHAGELLYDRVPQIKSFIDGNPISQGILQYSAVGFFYSRDWSAGLNRIGPYGGFELKF